MLKTNDLLYKASHFNEAILRGLHVNVYQFDDLLDDDVIITWQSKDVVKIGDNYYLKSTCQFIVK